MGHRLADDFPISLGADVRLNTKDAAERRAVYGANDIVAAAPHGWREVMRDTARDPMI